MTHEIETAERLSPKAVPFQRGFDTPADEDFLGRWPLARKVATTLTAAPATCAVRIGVFGRWGTGKSSLLSFVKQLAERDGHVVVEFSPWGYSDSSQMWHAFMSAVVARLENDGQTVKGGWKTSSLFTKALELGKKLSDARSEARAIAGALDPFVKNFFSFTSDDLSDATSRLGGSRRLIVLVDDVDRTDPRLVPDLLFALRQLLDLPGLSWVLAIDPDLVGKALSVHHPGFSNATDFLEKILEFMFWIPEPTSEQLWRLAERDLRAFETGIDLNIVRQESALLPSNPRTLRTIVRQLWSLRSEIDRHHSDEIDHRLLIFAVLMRTLYRRLYDALVSERDHALLNELSLFWISRADEGGKRGAETLGKVKPLVEATVESAQRPAAEALLNRLAEHHFWTIEGFLYHAKLLDSPAVVTQAEFENALDSSKLSEWFAAHGERTHLPKPDIVSALFDEAVRAHNRFLQAAADRTTEEEQRVDIATVHRILGLLGRLGLDHGGFTGSAPILSGTQFRGLLSSISGWTHFVGPTYQQLREAEATLLCKLVEAATGDPFLFLNALSPWNARWHEGDPDRAEARKLHARITSLAEKRAAPSLLIRLVEPGGVGAILGIEEQAAARYLLFRPTSPLWQPPLREQVGALLTEATAAVGENSLDILRRLDTSSGNGIRGEIRVSELDTLAQDKEIVTWLWTAGTKRATNLRLFGDLKELRAHLEAKAGITLAEPAWWGRLDAELSRARGETSQSTPASETGNEL
jgi:hypothetical protein